MCDSPTHEDTLNYHILRYNRQIVRQPNRRKIKEKLRSQIEGFEVNTLNKVPFLFKKRAPTGYCRLPMLQQLEDLQLKLHRWRYPHNPPDQPDPPPKSATPTAPCLPHLSSLNWFKP